MGSVRSVEDKLREEYFELLPEIRRTLVETETRVRQVLLDVTLTLKRYERLLVTSRVKECDSAIDSLRRRQALGLFDEQQIDEYSLTSLRDLAAVRVMAFPATRFSDAHQALTTILSPWIADPVPGIAESEQPLALKYFGRWNAGSRVTAEVQIVPLLIGLFWEVEHSAIYKPNPNLRGVTRSEAIMQRRNEVLIALRAFEAEFESALRAAASPTNTDVSDSEMST